MLISWVTAPPYSHALDRPVDNLEAAGLDVTPLRDPHLKTLNRMNSETRYFSKSEAQADRFDGKDSAQARRAAEQVLTFTKTSAEGCARYRHDFVCSRNRYSAKRDQSEPA